MIRHDPVSHKYFVGDKEIESVTSYIKKYKTIDAHELLMKKYKLSREDVLKAISKDDNEVAEEKKRWQKLSQDAMKRGTEIHERVSKELLGEKQDDKICSMVRNWIKENQMEVVKVEQIVYDPNIGLAGTIDALFKKGDKYILVDWKTGKKIKDSSNMKMAKPFHEYDDCPMSHYTIQLNIYASILEKMGYKISEKIIVHLTEDELTIHSL